MKENKNNITCIKDAFKALEDIDDAEIRVGSVKSILSGSLFESAKKDRNIRPTKEETEEALEDGWDEFEATHGYGIFQNDDEDFEYISRIDSMHIFDGDVEAAYQAKRDGQKFLDKLITKAEERYIVNDSNCSDDIVSAKQIIDTPHNREVLERIRKEMNNVNENVNESAKKGVVDTYLGYTIHDVGDRYVVTDKTGKTIYETKNGLPVIKDLIDDWVTDTNSSKDKIDLDKTADELAYERYKRGEYTYQDYVDVCNQEECEPLPKLNEDKEETKKDNRIRDIYNTLETGGSFELKSLKDLKSKNIFILPIKSSEYIKRKPEIDEFIKDFNKLRNEYLDNKDDLIIETFHSKDTGKYSIDISRIVEVSPKLKISDVVDKSQECFGYIDDNGNYFDIKNLTESLLKNIVYNKTLKETYEDLEIDLPQIAEQLAEECNKVFPEANITSDDIEFDDSRAWSLYVSGSKLGLNVNKFGSYRVYNGGGTRGPIEHNGRTQDGTVELGNKFADALKEIEEAINKGYEDSEDWDKPTGVLFNEDLNKYLEVELEDDSTKEGGVSFKGETVKDFIDSLGDDGRKLQNLNDLNKALSDCGIKPLKESKLVKDFDMTVSKEEIKSFLQSSVDTLIDNEDLVRSLHLGAGLYLVVGYSEGFGKEFRDDVIQSSENPAYAICAKIAYNESNLSSDYESDWSMPIYSGGSSEVFDSEVSIEPKEDYSHLVTWFIQNYHEIIKGLNDGTILCESLSKTLTESETVNLRDIANNNVKELKDEDTSEEDGEESKELEIIDPEAQDEEDLKDTYEDETILECPSCHALIYKKTGELVKDEEDDKYNKEEACPKCGATIGFELSEVGVDKESEEEIEADFTYNDMPSDKIENKKEEDNISDEEDIELEVEGFDATSYNKLVSSYLTETYEDVKSFKTSSAKLDKNSLVIEGVISYNDGTTLNTSFKFKAIDKNHYRGLNESLSGGDKAFKLKTSVKDKLLISESFIYNYKINESVIKGKKIN